MVLNNFYTEVGFNQCFVDFVPYNILSVYKYRLVVFSLVKTARKYSCFFYLKIHLIFSVLLTISKLIFLS